MSLFRSPLLYKDYIVLNSVCFRSSRLFSSSEISCYIVYSRLIRKVSKVESELPGYRALLRVVEGIPREIRNEFRHAL
jgi:hypothetical protein